MKRFIKTSIKEYLNENLSLIRGVGKNESGNVDLFGKGLYLTDNNADKNGGKEYVVYNPKNIKIINIIDNKNND